jgi:hypothetical protein
MTQIYFHFVRVQVVQEYLDGQCVEIDNLEQINSVGCFTHFVKHRIGLFGVEHSLEHFASNGQNQFVRFELLVKWFACTLASLVQLGFQANRSLNNQIEHVRLDKQAS